MLLHTHHGNNAYILSLRLFAEWTDINIKFVSGNITMDRGNNLANVSIPCMLSSSVDRFPAAWTAFFLAMLCVRNADSICGCNMNFNKRNHDVVKKKHIQMTEKIMLTLTLQR